MKNKDLKLLYDHVYQQGKQNYFSKFEDGKNISDTDRVVLAATNWVDKLVLDVGCGTGTTTHLISQAGAKHVFGIDFSEEAVSIAIQTYHSDNLSFQATSLHEWIQPVDVVVSCGTLEHMDDPGGALRKMGTLVSPGGTILITCPYFLNIRGFIWMTLQTLLEVPMSLTDLYFISPFDIENWLAGTSLHLAGVQTFDYDWGNGVHMLRDLKKRLTNALRDANLKNSNVDKFIDWLEKAVVYRETHQLGGLEGATALYRIQKTS